MPSPFPGMNPYFEQAAHWQDFHGEFLSTLRHQLLANLSLDYFVQLEEHLFVHDLAPEPRNLVGRADLSLARSTTSAPGPPALAVLEAPAEVRLPFQEVERVPYLEVRDRRGREVIAVIELLSPSNKRSGEDRELYLAKRRELLHGTAHLIEIDLLRGWPPMPAEGRPGGDYSVLVSRAERRPAAEFWPIGLRQRLPIIPIPLKVPHVDARVDLQEALHRTYDRAGYERFIYEYPPEPSLSPEDAEWARGLVPVR